VVFEQSGGFGFRSWQVVQRIDLQIPVALPIPGAATTGCQGDGQSPRYCGWSAERSEAAQLLFRGFLIHLVQAAVDGVEAFDDFRITTGAVFVLDLDERREGDATLQQ